MRARDDFAENVAPGLRVDALRRGMWHPQRSGDELLNKERETAALVAFPALAQEIKRLVEEGKLPPTAEGLAVCLAVFDRVKGTRNEILRAASRSSADVRLFFKERELPTVPPTSAGAQTASTEIRSLKRVAVVHGRNAAAADGMFALLRELGLEPVPWADAWRRTENAAATVPEVLDALFTDLVAVVVVFTGDEQVALRPQFCEKPEEARLDFQSRPNVFYEAGLAMGRYPKKTVLVEMQPHRSYSDIHGRMVVPFDGQTASRQKLVDALAAAGVQPEKHGERWLTAGQRDFEVALAQAKMEPSSTPRAPDEELTVLDEDDFAFLDLVAFPKDPAAPTTIDVLMKAAQTDLQSTLYRLDRLEEAGLTQTVHGNDWGPTRYVILAPGRKALARRGKLGKPTGQ